MIIINTVLKLNQKNNSDSIVSVVIVCQHSFEATYILWMKYIGYNVIKVYDHLP